jgi:hypothetical protein
MMADRASTGIATHELRTHGAAYISVIAVIHHWICRLHPAQAARSDGSTSPTPTNSLSYLDIRITSEPHPDLPLEPASETLCHVQYEARSRYLPARLLLLLHIHISQGLATRFL